MRNPQSSECDERYTRTWNERWGEVRRRRWRPGAATGTATTRGAWRQRRERLRHAVPRDGDRCGSRRRWTRGGYWRRGNARRLRWGEVPAAGVAGTAPMRCGDGRTQTLDSDAMREQNCPATYNRKTIQPLSSRSPNRQPITQPPAQPETGNRKRPKATCWNLAGLKR